MTIIHLTLVQAAPRPFDSVFSGDIKGDLVMAGNSNILQSAWTDNPTPASIDGDSTDLCLERSIGGELCRNNSSSALLDVPDNARIIEARLYVQTTLNPNVEPVQVRIAGPDDGFSYATAPNAEISKLYEATAGTSPGNYPRDSMRSAVFDVTDLVQAQGGGDYTVADIVYERDGSSWMPYAGWTIMVAYEWDDTAGIDLGSLSPAEQYRYKLRSVSWSDGMLYQTSGTTTVTLDNFQVPDSGPKFGKTFHSVAHGQLGYADALDFNGQPLGDNNAAGNSVNPFETIGSDPMCNATNDVQNDTMCYLGSHVASKNPGANAYTASGNNFTPTSSTSIDADVIRIPDSYLTPGLTTAEVDIRTIGDEWLTPTMLAVSVDLPEPVAQINKTISPVTGDPIEPGQQFAYTITVENTHGSEEIVGLSLVDDLADIIDDATYNNDLAADIGTATFTAPDQIGWSGDLGPGQVATITYSVTVNDPLSGDGRLINGVVSSGQSNCTEDPTIDPDCMTIAPLPDISAQKELVGPSQPQAGDTVTYRFTVTNGGDSAAAGISVSDSLADVLDDAVYNNDAVITPNIGTVSFSPANQRLTWSGALDASGDPQDSVTIEFTVTVNDANNMGDGVLRNALLAPNCPSPAITDPDDPDFDPDCATVTPVTAWHVTKLANPIGVVEAGEVLSYTVQVQNTGGADLTDLEFTDDLTAVLDDAAYNNDQSATIGSVSYASPTIIWNGDLAAGGISTITYSVTINDASSLGDGLLTNAVTGSPNCPSPAITDPDDPDFNADCVTNTQVAAWTAVKSSNASDPVSAGDTITYTVTVENTGSANLEGVYAPSFTDDLSNVLDDATYNNDASATIGVPAFSEPYLEWSNALAVGETSVITYSVTVNSVDELGDSVLTNAITGAPNCPDPAITDPDDPDFNSDCITTDVVTAWLATKTVTPEGAVSPGAVLNYSVTVENLGGTDLTDLEVADDLTAVLDDATYNNDAVASLGDVTYSAPTLTWQGDLAQGENAILSYSVTVNDAANLGDGILNNALTGPPNCPSDDCETENLVEAWSATKSAAPNGVVNPGDTVEYTLEVVNEGAADLSNLSVEDDLSGVLDDAVYNNDGNATIGSVSFTTPSLTWSGDLNAGENATITYTVTVNAADSLGDGVLNNAITDAPNCPAAECETENPIQAWVARKSVSPTGGINPGEVLTYTVTVENTGGADLTGANTPSVQDDLTAVLDDATYNNDESATIGGAAYAEPIIDWSGELLVGESSDITYSVTVNDAASLGDGLLNNIVTGAPNCPDDVCETATRVANFEVEKTSNPEDGSDVMPGQDVTYTITIRNTGTLDLTDFAFDDNLSGVLNNATFIGSPEVSPANSGSASLSGTTLSFAGGIPEGETVTVSYTVNVNDNAPAGVELRNVVMGDFSNCVTGEEPECITTHTVVDRDPPSLVPSLEDLAETGRTILPYLLGAVLLIATGFGVMKWAPRRLR